MIGNVYEWCSDYYQSDYYSVSPAMDPQGPVSGTERVLRGAVWFGFPLVNWYRATVRPSDSGALRRHDFSSDLRKS
ncbi:MAG: formylglycine-generating enzyme family protein [Candidatus Competibacteraceae bacterium]|nr:formylglycine-generating enzyme family protein [Candidatus Competibacteraceae bacterium]